MSKNLANKKITITLEDAARDAIHQMENCMAYISTGNHRMAHINFGMAAIYTSYLEDEGIFLEEENEHYKTMMNIYYDTYVRKN